MPDAHENFPESGVDEGMCLIYEFNVETGEQIVRQVPMVELQREARGMGAEYSDDDVLAAMEADAEAQRNAEALAASRAVRLLEASGRLAIFDPDTFIADMIELIKDVDTRRALGKLTSLLGDVTTLLRG